MASLQLQEALAGFERLAERKPVYNDQLTPNRMLEWAQQYEDCIGEFEEVIATISAEMQISLNEMPSDVERRQALQDDRSLCISYLENLAALDELELQSGLNRRLSRKPRQYRVKMLRAMSQMRMADHRLRNALRTVLAEIDKNLEVLSVPPDPWPPEDRND